MESKKKKNKIKVPLPSFIELSDSVAEELLKIEKLKYNHIVNMIEPLFTIAYQDGYRDGIKKDG